MPYPQKRNVIHTYRWKKALSPGKALSQGTASEVAAWRIDSLGRAFLASGLSSGAIVRGQFKGQAQPRSAARYLTSGRRRDRISVGPIDRVPTQRLLHIQLGGRP
jgi:hypothetical protein